MKVRKATSMRNTETAPARINPALPATPAVIAYRKNAKAANTWAAYKQDWQAFSDWCKARALAPLAAPSSAVCEYLAEQAGRLKASSLERQLAGIGQAFTAANLPNPCRGPQVREVLKGIKREQAAQAAEESRPVTRKAKAATADVLALMVHALPESPSGLRDRALLTLGMAGGFRRSELVGLNVADLESTPEGLLVTVRQSKTDQEGKGISKPIAFGRGATCPVRALRAWLKEAGITAGPVFRGIDRWGQVQAGRLTGAGAALAIKRAAAGAGLDPEGFSGHSLRRGMATQAGRAGAQGYDIMRLGGWKSERIVNGYIAEGRVWQNTAIYSLGL